jgi:predicted dehydrogenase
MNDPRVWHAASSRRTFVQAATGAALASLPLSRSVHAAGSDVLRVAFIGCGGRGTGACRDALVASNAVKLVAMADVLGDRLESSLRNLLQIDEIKNKIDVPPERRFTGFDAYQKAIDCGVDLVLLTTPPVFRPMQYAAAVKARKHLLMEKPSSVAAPGYRA